MQKMDLYVSGILYGTLILSKHGARVSLLDPFTGVIRPEQPVDESLQKKLFPLTRQDIPALGKRLSAAQESISRGEDSFTLPDGSVYQKADAHHYIQRQVKYPADLIVQNGQIVGVQSANRENICIMIEPEWKALTVLPQWEQVYPQSPFSVESVRTEMIPMRDDVNLAADIWLPRDAPRPLPCVLIRTPYGRQAASGSYLNFVQRGYAVVIQDVRGRNDSEGQWQPLTCETEDGSDTLDWIAAQPWCDGNIGMIGASYLGYVQWAAAASGNPHLKALVSEVAAGSAFADMPRRGGTLSSGMLAWAFAVSKPKLDPSLMLRKDWEKVLAHRPLTEVCWKALGYDIPFWHQWLLHTCEDDYWRRGNWFQRASEKGIRVPALIMSGWFDDNSMGTTQALELTKDYPAGMRKVILGPWMHSGNANYDLHGVDMGSRALRYDLDLLYFMWFERYLRGAENGIDKTEPIEYFTLGENRWKQAKQWPPEYTQTAVYYLDGENAATSRGSGRLSRTQPAVISADAFRYDPANPATHIIDVSENELEVPEDYTDQELRPDYLCYTSPPLEDDVTFTGDVLAVLFLSSDAPDTDLIVRLTKVNKQGRSIKLADGVLDVKFRQGFDREVFIVPGEVYPVTIRTTKVSVRFCRGERLRLTITSSAKNLAFPNSGTKEGYLGTDCRQVNNTVYHGGSYPSRIVLHCEI